MKTVVLALATLGLVVGSALPSYAASGCASQMKMVKAEWDKAPAGAKKDAAHKFYLGAEKAMKAKNDKACLADLDKATAALK